MKKILLPFAALALTACATTSESSDAPSSEPTAEAAPAEAAPEMDAEGPADIVTIAASTEGFSTLVAAVKAADLVETLQGEGPYTVFAPTDEAFAKLPEGTIEALLEDKEKLTQILTYHVVSGAVMSGDVAGMSSATTVQGGSLPIDASNGVKVGAATVVQADIKAKNGVIHVIDTVLIPEG